MKHRYSTIAAKAGLTLALIAFSSNTARTVSALTFTEAPKQSPRVVSATLAASPDMYDGQCPVTIRFSGNITVKGEGPVKYTFVRSNGATEPVYTLDFDVEGTKAVETNWTLNLTTFDEWVVIKILSPNELQSDRASFKGACLRAMPSQNNSQNAASRINSLDIPLIQPSQASRGEFIACPVQETRTEVTTPLPQPWWNTPQIGKVERVSVQTIGGNKTLVCEYWAYGRTVSIMRAFPERATDCSSEGNGFRCR